MHKLTKGLKKKKKGKKSKRKEEELFKPEELEVYRKEHQGTSDESAEKNEEWKKFIALTSGVDDILKKTQGDLDRIKSTSFFQRKPTESQVRAEEEKAAQVERQRKEEQEVVPQPTSAELGIVEVAESESEEEDDDNIFDTAYIDAITAGEVKLAYIPESPTEKLTEDDPFDTSIAERAILGPEVERKGKKLVPIGVAVEVLTGRVQIPTCATKRPTSRRQVLKERDLLLGSFDENTELGTGNSAPVDDVPRTLLDDDFIPLPDEPINLISPANQLINAANVPEKVDDKNDIISEFDTIANSSEDPDDIEFEALAAESLSKSTTVLQSLPISTSIEPGDIKWNAFDDKKASDVEDDPFDTTFAENILPGKAELKIIEKEILNEGPEFQFQEDKFELSDQVSIQISNSTVHGSAVLEETRVSESELTLIKPIHRDLLGGSNTDLSTLNNQPLQPTDQTNAASNVAYCDPFNTPDIAQRADITLLEKELLEDAVLSDDDFDPRARERTVSRPDVLNISGVKTVSFDVSSPKDLLNPNEGGKVIKPLTPFYTRKNSVPKLPSDEDISDPFDTSFASNIAPGKAELKVIESELFDPNIEKELSLVDNDFDPRDEKKAEIDKVVEIIKDITNIKLPTPPAAAVDLLAIDDNISAKVLTPGGDTDSFLSYCDPFDTSAFATNILPGKTELKLLETEFIDSKAKVEEKLDDLLENHHDLINAKPLSPFEGIEKLSPTEDFDPFDTTIANNIQPGKAELKLLESEFI